MSSKTRTKTRTEIITKTIMADYKFRGYACIPEMQIGDLAYKLGLNDTGLTTKTKRRTRTRKKGAYRMRPDIWLVNRDGQIVIIEVKSSRADFISDKKWHIYRQFCDMMYFAIDGSYINRDELPAGIGLMKLDESERGFYFDKKAKTKKFDLTPEIRCDLMFRMARSLSNRQCLLK